MWSESCVLRHAYYTGLYWRSLTRIISSQNTQGAWSGHLHDPLVIHEAKPDGVRGRWCDFAMRWFVAVLSYYAILPLDEVSICRILVWAYSLAFERLWSGAYWVSRHFSRVYPSWLRPICQGALLRDETIKSVHQPQSPDTKPYVTTIVTDWTVFLNHFSLSWSSWVNVI